MNEFGFSPARWAAAKAEAKDAMVARAKMRGMIPYSELVSNIHAIHFDPHDIRLNHLLGEISTKEDAAGRGMLSVVVVHKTGDMQPVCECQSARAPSVTRRCACDTQHLRPES